MIRVLLIVAALVANVTVLASTSGASDDSQETGVWWPFPESDGEDEES